MHYDLIVIGAGSGNSIVDEAFAGLRVALVEDGLFGGTCINVGCIPTKMYVYPADLAAHATEGPRLGVRTRFEGADWPAIRDRVFGRIDPIESAGRRYREESPLADVYAGTARFTAEHALTITMPDGAQAEITGDRIVIAAGTRPVIPDVPGLDQVEHHTSDTVMRLDALPERLGIIGGGFIGCEFAHVFSAYGTQVTQVHTHSTLLNHHDHEVAQRFTQAAAARWEVRLSSRLVGVTPSETGIALTIIDGTGHSTTTEVDALLLAVGRRPNSDRLDLERAGIALDERGHVVVDEQQRTSASGVWALGDICNTPALKHVANHEARVVRHNLLHPEQPLTSDLPFVPSAVFTYPQVASVGLTEEQARAAGVDVVTAIQAYADVAYGWAMEDEADFVKLIADRRTGLLVGAHIVGAAASILIQPLIQAMSFGQPVRGLARGQYWIHPALSEVIENALLTLESSLADSADL
jgi:mycothione reductase